MECPSWMTQSAALLWALPVSAAIAAAAAPWGRRLAWSLGAVDQPEPRRTHQDATPRLGGLCAALAIFGCLALWLALDPAGRRQADRYEGFFAGLFAMFLVGLADDLRQLRPWPKLALQFGAAAFICFGGIRLDVVELPAIGRVDLGPAGPLVTMIWLVGVTNAINFLDGVDGLAAGTAALACSGFLLMAGFSAAGSVLGLLSVVLIGACIVLVLNNVRAPKLFLGDSGSLLLGALVGSLAILAARSGAETAPRMALPATALGVPLVDMVACIVRRVLTGRSIVAADRGHVHHMLMGLGFSAQAVVLILTSVTAAFALVAGAAAHGPAWAEWLALACVAAYSAAMYHSFGYLSPGSWRHYRRASRILRSIITGIRSPRPASHPGVDLGREQAALDGLRRARRTLGLDYLRVERTAGGAERAATILEIGRPTRRLLTTRVYVNEEGRAATLRVVLGQTRLRNPATLPTKEQLMLPLLAEVAATLGGCEMPRAGDGASPGPGVRRCIRADAVGAGTEAGCFL